MIDEVSDVLGWNRKHAIKALNGKVSLRHLDPDGIRMTSMGGRRW